MTKKETILYITPELDEKLDEELAAAASSGENPYIVKRRLIPGYEEAFRRNGNCAPYLRVIGAKKDPVADADDISPYVQNSSTVGLTGEAQVSINDLEARRSPAEFTPDPEIARRAGELARRYSR